MYIPKKISLKTITPRIITKNPTSWSGLNNCHDTAREKTQMISVLNVSKTTRWTDDKCFITPYEHKAKMGATIIVETEKTMFYFIKDMYEEYLHM